MLFFPYRLDVSLYRIPFLTVLACIACVVTFVYQIKSMSTFEGRIAAFCAQDVDENLRAMLAGIDDPGLGSGCADVFTKLRSAPDREQKIAKLAREVRGLEFYRDRRQDIRYKEDSLRAGLADFERFVPPELTDRLAYRPDRYSPVAMVTSTFAHGSVGHLLGNLVFFFIFASCVECALGGLHFVGAFVVMAVVCSLAYSHSVSAQEALPTIGLSGVAMGMMAMLTTMLPRARVWCVFWFILILRFFTVPVIAIALWQIGWNLYELAHPDPGSHVNYVAHVSGAACGIVLGLIYRLSLPHSLAQLERHMG